MIPDPAWRTKPWGVIADDLTGATDTAAAFARAGFGVMVILDPARARGLDAQVLVLSSHSRQCPPALARRRVQAACHWLRRRGAAVIYKKMDSTLHGNIAAEVAAIRDAAGFATALVCPANPVQGRCIRQGRLTVHGTDRGALVERLAWASPAQPSRQVASGGPEQFASVLLPFSQSKVKSALGESRFVLADATTEQHLKKLAQAALGFRRGVLLAGSAGMAWALASQLGRRTSIRRLASRARPSPQRPAGRSRPFLIFSGSTNTITQQQIERLARRSNALVTSLTARTARLAGRALAGNRTVVVRIPIRANPPGEILKKLRQLSPLLQEHRPGGLAVVGGDTARMLCRWLRPRGLAIRGEILPGLAWGHWVGGLADGMLACTKPGGFGSRDALLKLIGS
jgi:uncharacterized protein YgbK (DUF1537 family)